MLTWSTHEYQANILVSPAGIPLLADFGIAQMLCSSSSVEPTSSELKGSVRWMAIELFNVNDSEQSIRHTKETDVWAYGMVIYVRTCSVSLFLVI